MLTLVASASDDAVGTTVGVQAFREGRPWGISTGGALRSVGPRKWLTGRVDEGEVAGPVGLVAVEAVYLADSAPLGSFGRPAKVQVSVLADVVMPVPDVAWAHDIDDITQPSPMSVGIIENRLRPLLAVRHRDGCAGRGVVAEVIHGGQAPAREPTG